MIDQIDQRTSYFKYSDQVQCAYTLECEPRFLQPLEVASSHLRTGFTGNQKKREDFSDSYYVAAWRCG